MLKAKVAQQTLRRLDKNFKAFTLVPKLCLGMPSTTLRVECLDAERP
jgi:hypothetical protein